MISSDPTVLKSAVKVVAPCDLNRLQILFMGDSAIDFRIVMGPVLGPVLVHNIDVGMDGDFFCNESKDRLLKKRLPWA